MGRTASGKVLVRIGREWLVVEHEQATGKLVQVLVEAEEVRCGLPTCVLCAAGAEEDGSEEMRLGSSELGSGSNGIGCMC
jgi:hypothetical protein